jgi:NAD-dependent DNA ligase
LGGNIQSSVGSKTSYVVKEHSSGTSKEKKALDIGVPVITVSDLEKML